MPERAATAQFCPEDPLLYRFPLELERTFFPMGFPVRISTNSDEIVLAAGEVWGCCAKSFDEPPLQLRLGVRPGSSDDRPPAVLPRAQGNLISMVHSADNFAVADLAGGFGFGWFTEAMVRDHAYFRYHFLEALAYVGLDYLYLTPVHAACISLSGRGVLLCGESGAGKTSLSYACARRGWTFTADDASHLVRKQASQRLIAGRPSSVRFRESAKHLFSELGAFPAHLRVTGKMDIEASSQELGLSSLSAQTYVDFGVFLKRDDSSGARLSAYPKEGAIARLEQVICFGEPNTQAAQRASLHELAAMPFFELTYSGLDDAERCLRSLVTEGAA